MKNYFLKFSLLTLTILILLLIYLSTIGLKTDKLNDRIKNEIYKSNNSLDVEFKKIRLTLDPFNFKINAKTIGSKIFYKGKILPLEYINAEISILSLIKKKITSSKLQIFTRSVLLRDLIILMRAITNKPELYLLEESVKKGQAILNINFNVDDSGKIKQDYQINITLKDAKIEFLKHYNFEKINFILNANNNIFNFTDLSFTINESDFFSENLKITKDQKNYFVEGDVQNENSVLNDELLKLFNLNFKNTKILNTNYNSKNIFSFNLDSKFKINNLNIDSDIYVNNLEYKKPSFISAYLQNQDDTIQFKDHKAKLIYKKNNLTIDGLGKIKIAKKFDDINYKINFKNDNLNLTSNLNLNELNLNKQEYLKSFFPKIDDTISLKEQQIKINYNNDSLSINSVGEIKLTNTFEQISFDILKTKNEYKFNTKIDLEKTLLNIDFLNFKKKDDLKTRIEISGSYDSNKIINLKKATLINKDNKILLEDLMINNINQVIKLEKLDLDFFDNQNKKNKILLTNVDEKNYKIVGLKLNANKLIDNLFKGKKKDRSKIFKNDLNLILNLKEVYLDDESIIKNFKGKLTIKDNDVIFADLFANFDKTDNLKFTIITNDNGEKITTFFSSRAKPIVARYNFIKGYEEGYLDFYSLKKDGISKSKLKVNDFKLQELPALTKLLTLASLQGIADTLSGEGIRFNEFEMNFTNKGNLMTIDEIYAIGPAISILMNGYIEEDKLVSLRGTLVPATTINKAIGSIPFLGKILIGDKTGEGVFGVSFKIKGPPKNLETTVNPIKTLTPRFITRTLEKIKNN